MIDDWNGYSTTHISDGEGGYDEELWSLFLPAAPPIPDQNIIRCHRRTPQKQGLIGTFYSNGIPYLSTPFDAVWAIKYIMSNFDKGKI